MDGAIGRSMDGWTYGSFDEWLEFGVGWTDGKVERFMDGQTEGWVDP